MDKSTDNLSEGGGMMKHGTIATFATTASLAAMLVGCADDSSSRRTTVRQTPSGVVTSDGRTVTSDGRTITHDSRMRDDDRVMRETREAGAGMRESGMRESSMREPGMRRLTDANILAILEASSFHTIQESKLAQQRAANPDVRLLASRLTQDHQALQQETSNVASRLNVTPALPAGERDMAMTNQSSMESLREKSGDAFDEAFLTHRIQMHEKMLNRLDEASTDVQSSDVRTLLAQARAGIQAHLKTARELQRDVTGSMSGGMRRRLP
jgi:putative membrane protein